MKIYMNRNWRYIRIVILWCLLCFAVYWYSINDRKRLRARKYSRLNRIIEARIKAPNALDDERNSILRVESFGGHVNTQNNSDTSERITRNYVTNINTFNNGSTSIDYNGIQSDVLFDERLSESMATNKPRSNNKRHEITGGSELSESKNNSPDDSNHQFNNGSKYVRNQQGNDESNEDTRVTSAQGELIVSSLREHIANVNVLNAHRLHWTIALAGTYSHQLYSPPPKEMPKQRLPQAIIIGFGKCGTRALLDFLSMHPYVVSAGPEIHFFDMDENFKNGLEWYRQQMPVSYSNQIPVEKTPSYVTSERARDQIYKLNKGMKLIVLVKDPVSRIVSQSIRSNPDLESMCLLVRDGKIQVNNESRTVQWSIYVTYLRMWMEKFPKSQIHVLETDEFVKHPAKEIQKLETFLGVPPMITEENFYFNKTKGFYCKRPFHAKKIACLAEGKGIKHPPLLPEVEKTLYDFFRGYNEELFRLLGRRFQWEPKRESDIGKERK